MQLAGPPSLASCTRDCYAPERRFSAGEVLRIAKATASAINHLHQRGILHGDLYAHNLLVDPNGQTLLSDFGAASFFDPETPRGQALIRLESRAFGYLLDELLARCDLAKQDERLRQLAIMKQNCLVEDPGERPMFDLLAEKLASIR